MASCSIGTDGSPHVLACDLYSAAVMSRGEGERGVGGLQGRFFRAHEW